jgi:hypothetical protein
MSTVGYGLLDISEPCTGQAAEGMPLLRYSSYNTLLVPTRAV